MGFIWTVWRLTKLLCLIKNFWIRWEWYLLTCFAAKSKTAQYKVARLSYRNRVIIEKRNNHFWKYFLSGFNTDKRGIKILFVNWFNTRLLEEVVALKSAALENNSLTEYTHKLIKDLLYYILLLSRIFYTLYLIKDK